MWRKLPGGKWWRRAQRSSPAMLAQIIATMVKSDAKAAFRCFSRCERISGVMQQWYQIAFTHQGKKQQGGQVHIKSHPTQ
mmetsp:Transcript_54629/g.116744  ORF Transcript_54629/g.116744 Transcript_54629/m.116744 type:complete len:80 (-) Transcript_54629:930-1169(-)